MTSKTNARFWDCYGKLPSEIQQLAREKFELWLNDPFHPSLQFKEVKPNLWSARVNLDYRVLAWRSGELVVWFWIGTHTEYDKLLR